MNKTILLLLALFVTVMSLSSKAQSTDGYHPFLKEGKVWNCMLEERYTDYVENQLMVYHKTTYFSLTLKGDSVVKGKTYHKMYKEVKRVERRDMQGQLTIVPIPDTESDSPDLWLEENNKIYLYREDEEQLHYDFSEQPGTTVYIGDVPTTIMSIDIVTANGQPFRRFNLSTNDCTGIVWIEGIGHPEGPTRRWGDALNDGSRHTLLSCYEDGKCIFTKNDFYSAPGTDHIKNLTPANYKGEGSIFDLQGRRLSRIPEKGMYIKDGKKYVK